MAGSSVRIRAFSRQPWADCRVRSRPPRFPTPAKVDALKSHERGTTFALKEFYNNLRHVSSKRKGMQSASKHGRGRDILTSKAGRAGGRVGGLGQASTGELDTSPNLSEHPNSDFSKCKRLVNALAQGVDKAFSKSATTHCHAPACMFDTPPYPSSSPRLLEPMPNASAGPISLRRKRAVVRACFHHKF